jgi:small subunit ribosomal protein S6
MARHYELVLMLDPEADDGAREKVAGDARARIESGGAIEHADSWGLRKLAYEIRQRTEADYRYFRFTAGNDVLDALDHSLKIADGVLRFRIFTVDPESPTTPPPASDRPASVGSDRPDRGDRRERRDRGDRGDRR